MPYFLRHFSKNWVKTLVQNPSARYFAEKVAYLEEIDKFWWFFGTLHKRLLISRRSTSFGGFSANALLFATFF